MCPFLFIDSSNHKTAQHTFCCLHCFFFACVSSKVAQSHCSTVSASWLSQSPVPHTLTQLKKKKMQLLCVALSTTIKKSGRRRDRERKKKKNSTIASAFEVGRKEKKKKKGRKKVHSSKIRVFFPHCLSCVAFFFFFAQPFATTRFFFFFSFPFFISFCFIYLLTRHQLRPFPVFREPTSVEKAC